MPPIGGSDRRERHDRKMAKDLTGGGERRSSWWRVYGPMIGALLAAVAAIATAVITSRSNSADTERRIHHERAIARQDAVGAARVLAKELATVEVYMQGMLRVDQLIPCDDKYNVEISQEDQKRIAAAPEIGVDRWQRVAAALSNLDTLSPTSGTSTSEERVGSIAGILLSSSSTLLPLTARGMRSPLFRAHRSERGYRGSPIPSCGSASGSGSSRAASRHAAVSSSAG
jgi:hypothetical protein